MAGTKISALNILPTLVDASVLPVVDSSTNYKMTGSVLATYTTSKIPIATTGTAGLIKIDGTSVTISGGVISASTYTLPATTTTTLGGVIVPAVATSGITNTSGTIGLATATTTQLGGVIVPAVATSGITNTSGTIGIATATTTQLGGIKIDNNTIVINNGVISVGGVLTSATIFKGSWDASTNTPALSNSLPAGVQAGWQYIVSVLGTRDIGAGSTSYTVGDLVIYNGTSWSRIPGGNSVTAFNTRQGSITLTSSDVTTALGFTPGALAGSASITTLGTISTGVWNGTAIAGQYGGTGVDNTGKSITLGGNFTTSGAYATTLTATAITSVTLPTTGTLATLAGTETFTNKTLTSPTLTTPVLGTPSSGTLTSCTGLPVATGVSGLGTGVATFLATPSSANLLAAVTGETGTGALVFATSPTLVTPVLGTPSSGTLTSCTGLPVATGVSGLGTGVATFLATPSSANLAAAITDETGTGALVFGTSPAITTSITTASTTFALINATATTVNFAGGATTALNIGASGAPITGFSATATTSSTASSLGYLGTPINTQAGTYTLVIGDAGKTIYAAGNLTIPANATVAFPVGTIINVIASAGITIAITSNTLQWGGQATSQTGTRTVAAYGMATLVKVATTTWYISGAGVT